VDAPARPRGAPGGSEHHPHRIVLVRPPVWRSAVEVEGTVEELREG
jgi:hypothetical protein